MKRLHTTILVLIHGMFQSLFPSVTWNESVTWNNLAAC